MDDTNDKEAKFEYLKLLLEQRKQSSEAFSSAIQGFFTFAAIVFIFSSFRTSELSLFGAKVDIPQNVISSIAPIVLSFYFIRAMSLYESQGWYVDEVEKYVPQVLQGNKWKLNNIQVRKLAQSIFWFNFPTAKEGNMLYVAIYSIVGLGIILGLFLVPLLIIGYFMWGLWQSQGTQQSTIITLISALMIIPSIVILFHRSQEELFAPKK